MKKKLSIPAIIIILSFFAACSSNNKKQPPVSKKESKEKNVAVMRKVKIENGVRELQFGFPVSDDSSTGGFIEFDLARQMSLAYKSNADKITIEGEEYSDAANIHFSLDRIESFIARIEAAFPEGGCRPDLGIKFYYIRYPANMDKPGLEGLSDIVAKHHSLMMVPTYTDDDGNVVDFNLDEIGDPCQPTPYWRTSEAARKKRNILFSSPSKASRMMNGGIPRTINHGGLTPPPDDEPGTFPTPSGPTVAAPPVLDMTPGHKEKPAAIKQ